MASEVELSDASEMMSDQSMSQVIHRVVQFLRVVRYRINVIFVALLVSALLGGLYYATATRYYRADAKVLILKNGSDASTPTMGGDGGGKEYMPTYEQLLKSSVVLRDVYQGIDPRHRIDFYQVPPAGHVGVLQGGLSMSTVRRTNIIQLSYRSKDPQAAEAVVNSLLQSYFNFIDRTHKSNAGDIARVLETEKAEIAEQLKAKEDEHLRAREGFGDLGIGKESSRVHPAAERALRANDRFIEANQERLKRQAALASIRKAIRDGADLQQHLMATEETVGRAMLLASFGLNAADAHNQSALQRTLLEDRSKAASLSAHYGPNHPELAEINQRVRQTEQFLRGYSDNIKDQLSTLKDKELGPRLTRIMEQALAEAWQQENEFRAAFAAAKKEAVHLNSGLTKIENLGHEVERLRNLHEVLIKKIAGIALETRQGDIRATIVKKPEATASPVSPRLATVIAVCILGAVTIGGLLIFIQDALDDRFRSPDDVTLRLGVPTLAMVARLGVPEGSGIDAVQSHVNPTSPETESFRTLRTALSFNAEETRQIVVSSSEPGDGKTTVLANLGVSIAQSGKKVLLIDADLRRPGLTALFVMKRENGLSDVLRSEEDVATVAQRHIRGLGTEGLDILPSGPRRPNPGELLTSKRLEDLLAWAETHYDQILIDSPPVLAANDVMLLGRLADGVVLVINPDKNRRRLVTRAFEGLRSMSVNVLGIVANRIDTDSSKGYGYGYGYTYAYQYGETEAEQQMTAAEEAATYIPPQPMSNAPAMEMPPPYPVETPSGQHGDPSGIVPRRVA